MTAIIILKVLWIGLIVKKNINWTVADFVGMGAQVGRGLPIPGFADRKSVV